MGRDLLLLLSRSLASPVGASLGEQVSSNELGFDAQDGDRSQGGGLGGSEGEEGGGTGDGSDCKGAGGARHLLEQDEGDGQGNAEEGAEHLAEQLVENSSCSGVLQ